jgi:hypothetical protein
MSGVFVTVVRVDSRRNPPRSLRLLRHRDVRHHVERRHVERSVVVDVVERVGNRVVLAREDGAPVLIKAARVARRDVGIRRVGAIREGVLVEGARHAVGEDARLHVALRTVPRFERQLHVDRKLRRIFSDFLPNALKVSEVDVGGACTA